MKPRLILDMPEDEYHADPLGNSLSATGARTLVTKSAMHAHAMHPQMGNHSKPPTELMEKGSAIHSLILHSEDIVDVLNFKDWRTNAAKDARAASRAQCRVPLLPKEFAKARLCASSATALLSKAGRPLDGHAEATILFPVKTENGGEIMARARLDHVLIGQHHAEIDDIKTMDDVSALKCRRQVEGYELGIQESAYRAAVEAVYPHLAGRVEYRLLFVERTAPYAVRVCCMDSTQRARGDRLWRLACETWAKCLSTGEWPGYAAETTIIHSSGWLEAQEATLEYEQTIHCD